MKRIPHLLPLLLICLTILSNMTFALEVDIPLPPTYKETTSDTNFDRQSFGVVDILYNPSTTKKTKLMVQHDQQKYIYDLKSAQRYVAYPLHLGDGSYSVSIYVNTTGTKYKKTYSTSKNIQVADTRYIYLNSIQQVEWYNDDLAIDFANSLLDEYINKAYGYTDIYGVRHVPDDPPISYDEIINLYYEWVVENLSYDYDKIQTLSSDYVPDIDEILAAKGGICYDYSVLFAAMLRSQGIPVKLIKGYTDWTSVYHAWNEIYIEESDEWIVVDTTFDSYLDKRNGQYKMEKDATSYMTSYFY